MKKIKDISGFIIAVEFFLAIALSYLFFNREPGRESAAENRRLALFPAYNNDEGLIPETFVSSLSDWFEDNLGLRDFYLTVSGIINYNVLNRSKTDKVQLGKDGFLFLSDEGNLSLEASRSSDFIMRLPEYAKDQQAVSDKLKAQGIDYVLMLCPGKPSIYPEDIASSHHEAEDTIGDAMYDRLASDTDVHVSWSKDLLASSKDNEDGELIYLKTDTHWTTYGRNIAYRELLSDLKKWGIADASPAKVSFYKASEPYVGDLSNMMGPVTSGGGRLAEESFTDWDIVSPKAHVIDKGEKYEAFRQMLEDKNVYNPELCVMYHNDEAYDKKVLICGDSMVGICLLPQLAESFSDLTFIWSYTIDQDFIDFVKPDLVISEFGEREMPLRLDDMRGFTE